VHCAQAAPIEFFSPGFAIFAGFAGTPYSFENEIAVSEGE
jgi:hypothetical protein